MPGKEALYEPGKSDGQTKLVREGTKVTVFSWSAAQKEWTKVGDVAGANEENSGKTLHQGKVRLLYNKLQPTANFFLGHCI